MSIKNRIKQDGLKNISLESIDLYNLQKLNISNESISETVSNLIKHLKDMFNKIIGLIKSFINSIILKFKKDKYDPENLRKIPKDYKPGISFNNQRLANYYCTYQNGKFDTPDIIHKNLDFSLGNIQIGSYHQTPSKVLDDIIRELSVYDLKDNPSFDPNCETNLRIIDLGGFSRFDDSLVYKDELEDNIFVDVRPSGARHGSRDGLPGNKFVKKQWRFNNDGLVISNNLSYIDIHPDAYKPNNFKDFVTPKLSDLEDIRERVLDDLNNLKSEDLLTYRQKQIDKCQKFFDDFSNLVNQKVLPSVISNYCILFLRSILNSMNMYSRVTRMHIEHIEHRLDLYNLCLDAK